MNPLPRLSPERHNVVWAPISKPQRALLSCPVFEVFFGGARGGGKTDGMLGEWAQHANTYGVAAIGLMLRRTAKQLGETFERAKVLYLPLGAKFVGSPETGGMRVTMPNGARLSFAHLERDADAENYQGGSYCVGVGTPIRMADGGLKPIEAIGLGEFVATLEGPRRVLATTKPYLAPCIRALVRDGSGELVGSQVHPVWHPVLTTFGLTSGHTFQTRQICVQPPRQKAVQSAATEEFPPDSDLKFPAWLAYSEDGRSDCKASSGECGGVEPQRPSTVPVVLHEPSSQSTRRLVPAARERAKECRSPGKFATWSCSLFPARTLGLKGLRRLSALVQSIPGIVARAFRDALSCGQSEWKTVEGCPGGYRVGYDSDGGCAQFWSGSDLRSLRSPNGVEPPCHTMLQDGWGTTHKRNPCQQSSWVHPYTGEARCLSESVALGTMEMRPCGMAWVADLTVDGANHYITDTGLINKNTRIYVEEAGNFPSPLPIFKLMATLRSGTGVPCRIRLTGNPGGPGHQWIKARYIDPAPLGWKVLTDPQSGRERVYIPSRVSDNPKLGPDYISNLKALGSPELVRAWLEGDFNVVAGAYFPEFDVAKHVIPAQALPAHWTRLRAFDWGSARPFCCLWIAVSDGTGQFPANALIVYREWYGSTGEPNVGLKLPAEAVGTGILSREDKDERVRMSVCDPAMMKEDGGPSMAERMRGIPWSGADNSRLAGWDQVRSRLIGLDGKPMLYVFSTCTNLIRTLPALQHDTHKPEDLDSDGEDHAADTLRYGCMSRPWTAAKPKPAAPADTWAKAFAKQNSGYGGSSWKVA